MLSDFRFALRLLAKSPGFTAIAILTLSLGIGAAATAFTAVNAILLRPLPLIQHQERMLHLTQSIPAKSIESTGISYADFTDWTKQTRTLDAVWLYQIRTVIVARPGEPRRIAGAGITPGAFQAMGVAPIQGRHLTPADDLPGAEPVALLGYRIWKTLFAGADDIVGQTVTLNSVPTTIVGIMPDGWRYPETSDMWLPMRSDGNKAMRGYFEFDGHAMLKPGVSLDEARAEFATFSATLAQEYPATNDGVVAVLRPVREEATEDLSRLTLLAFGAVLAVFLIACANVANLLLARASVRAKEIAIRLALGATRLQLVQQLLLESLLLSVAGALGGLILALWGIDLMLTAIPENLIAFWMRFELDPRVFAFVAGLALLATLLFGLVPALQASRPEVIEEIKENGRSSNAGARTHRFRNTLVVAEIALALVLLVGAGLMLRSFLAVHRVDPGFDSKNVLTFRVGFPTAMIEAKNPKPAPEATSTPTPTAADIPTRFFAALNERLALLPGVEAAAATDSLPGLGLGAFSAIVIEGEPEPKTIVAARPATTRVITPDYFKALHIPLKKGRAFTATDTPNRPAAAIVDERFVAKFLPGTEPLGKRFRALGKHHEPARWLEIVGVVGGTRRSLDRDHDEATFYVPHAQSPGGNFMSVVLRVQGDPAAFIPLVRTEVLAVNKNLPIYNEAPFELALERSPSMWKRKFFSHLFTAVAIVALLLASVGIYGVMSYAVAQRTQEIGVRMALGAQPGEVVRMVVRHGLRLVGLGLAAGFIAALFIAQLLAGSLYGVSPHDPPTFALVPLLLAAVALVACYLPSRRATLIDPIGALRSE